MKKAKLFLAAVFAIAGVATVSAQPMAGYSCTTSVESYAKITDGVEMTLPAIAEGKTYSESEWQTQVFSGATTAITEATTATSGFNIGFDFKWGDLTMTKFAISPLFGLYFGESAIDVEPSTQNMLSSGLNNVAQYVSFNNMVFQQADTKSSYKLLGEAGSRTLVVQWENVWIYVAGYSFSGKDAENVTIQMRLNESDSSLEVVFLAGYPYICTTQRWNRFGIKGQGNDLHMRCNEGVNSDWTRSFMKTEDDTNLYYASEDSNVENGFTFKFVPGAACATPASQPTDLTASSTTTSASLQFTLAPSVADHYLLVWS